jgi:hypothetical protein
MAKKIQRVHGKQRKEKDYLNATKSIYTQKVVMCDDSVVLESSSEVIMSEEENNRFHR